MARLSQHVVTNPQMSHDYRREFQLLSMADELPGLISDTYLQHEQEFSRHTFLLCDSLCDFPNPIMTPRAARPLDRSKPHGGRES